MPQAGLAMDQVMQSISKARGLPNRHYTDPATFDVEKQALFFDNWAGLGFAKDVPEPGSVRPVDFLGVPLLIVRDRHRDVRVFQNTCRHRGMILVDEPCRLKGSIRCPYHSWSYALDGRLLTTPHVGGPGQNTHPDLDRATLGLIEIPSAVFQDVVFVNMSATAPPFEEAAADLKARWQEFMRPLYHAGDDSSFSLDVVCNWKLAVENYCESYHLPWIHPGLNAYSRLEDHYHIEHDGQYSGQGTMVYKPTLTDNGAAFPDFQGLSPIWDSAAEYIAFYPNVLFGVHRDHVFTILLEPKTVARTVEHIEIYYADKEAVSDIKADLRRKNARLWKGIFEEDIGVVEGMQRGRQGIKFDGGRFSPAMDGPTHCFHRWAASKLD